MKNTELEEERKRNHVDFSAIDTQMKSEYEKRLSHEVENKSLHFFLGRLKAELVKLRRMYEEETEKAKQEFMYLHSSKVKETNTETKKKQIDIETNKQRYKQKQKQSNKEINKNQKETNKRMR